MFPESIFKYSRFNNDTTRSLLLEQIWHSDVALFNDPFEHAFIVDDSYPTASSDLVTYLEKVFYFNPERKEEFQEFVTMSMLHDDYSAIYDFVETGIKGCQTALTMAMNERRVYLSCLSSNHNHPLMWSHYADSYRGICIVYDKYKLTELEFILRPIEYEDSIIKLSPIELFDRSSYSSFRDNLIKIITTKSKHWKYENEVRSIIYPTSEEKVNTPGLSKSATGCMQGIIYGYRMPQKDLELLKEICKIKNIPLYCATPNASEYIVDVG